MKSKIRIVISLITGVLSMSYAAAQVNPGKIRLSKMSYKGNDFTEVYDYTYDKDLRIKKITHYQNGKLFSVTADFVFNDKNLVVAYTKTYNSGISPERTTMTYDDKNRLKQLTVNRTDNSKKQPFVSSMGYKWNNDTSLTITDTKWFLGKIKQDIIYTFNRDGNIEKVEGLGEPSIAYTELFTNYDYSPNPLLLTGGYMEGKPLSKNNFSRNKASERHTYTTSITYQRILVHKHTPGGPKIPTTYKNGVPLSAVTNWYDPDAKRTITVGTTTYNYTGI